MRKGLLAGVAFGCLLIGGVPATAGNDRLVLTDAPANSSNDAIKPFYGSINPFYGNINPFYGSINPFYGNINPFYGQISPFWGNIQPFYGNINPFYGTINPFYGSINPFWGQINPFYGNINPFWGTIQPFWAASGPEWGAINTQWSELQAANASDYSGLQADLKTFFGKAETFWDPQVRKLTSKSFNDGFASGMLAKYGINVDDAASLADVSAQTRSAFFLNWYDGLMDFTGVDHVDWWMPAIHWSPLLTETQADGHKSIVGVLDSTFGENASGVAIVKFQGGYNTYVNDHGAAVASLIAAQHDGKAVMGIAPDAEVHLYNPFDQSGTANWNDVAVGISTLFQRGAHVVNASLGVPGYVMSNEWVNILSGPLLSNRKRDLVIVKAAGNEGVTQTQNVPWLLGLEVPNNIVMVGSVDPNKNISFFSNTPGEACLTVAGICLEKNKLKYRFLVAPGELILTSDNHGGVTRMTGTSFAAPLVTGAVALLQDRWPWLQDHAAETVQILLQSADDLGAPGVDGVYGWGMLNVEASQSPLDFDNLVVYQPYGYVPAKNVTNGFLNTGFLGNTTLFSNWSAKSLKASVLKPGQLGLWQNQSAFIVAYENIGLTFRDFQIPLSSLLVGKTQKLNGMENTFQSYLYQRLIDWANGNNTSFNAQAMPLSGGDWALNLTTTEATAEELYRGGAPIHTEFALSNKALGLSFKVGEGSGAHALAGMGAFSMRSDFDPATGGVNPILGFASGGAYAGGAVEIANGARLSLGFSQTSDDHTYVDPTFGPLKSLPLATSTASASTVGFDYTLAKGFTLNASYTHLIEDNGLLGAQGGGALDLAGAKTDAATVGASAALGNGWLLSASATMGHTSMASNLSALSLSNGGLDSTAYEIVAQKNGLFGELDALRLSLTQPLHVERGALNYQAVQVIDRMTGEVGLVTQTWNVSAPREYRLEALYNTAVLDNRAEIQTFSLVDLNPPQAAANTVSVSFGARFRIGL